MKKKTETGMTHRTAVRVLTVCCSLACAAFIFSNSLQSGPQSGSRSGAVLEVIQSLFAAAGLRPESCPSEFLIRKLGHFSEFALLGVCLSAMLCSFTPQLLRNLGWILFAGLATGVTDESIQLFVSGRSGEVRDVLIDFGGVLAGIALALLVRAARRAIVRRKRSSREQALIKGKSEGNA